MLRKELYGITLFAVILGSFPLLLFSLEDNFTLGHPKLQTFLSYSEMLDFLNRSYTSPPYYHTGIGGIWPNTRTFAALEDSASTQTIDFSKTNIQVEGVDEADIVKSDGKHIYLASNNSVLIVKAHPPQEAEVLSRIKLNGSIVGIFVNENKLIVFMAEYPEVICCSETRITSKTKIKIYNIEDRSEPILDEDISMDGYYLNSRMILDHVYILTTFPALIEDEKVMLPSITKENKSEIIKSTNIYYSTAEDCNHFFITVTSVNLQTSELVHETFLLGSATCIYVSQSSIYLAIPKYENNTQKTEIHLILIEKGEITYEASGEVLGYVLNQFSMDEHNGYFRIATTISSVRRIFEQAASINNVYVLSPNLTILGELEGLAPGERIYSTRFMGDRCYLVTFKKVDPLFVISLENPAKPEILGKLKIPGYSDYLHPYDENHLIGIGKETVEAEDGDFAWYQGVKISLFNVSDLENPIEITKFEIGDRGTDSPILWDHKALLFDKENNLLAIPILIAEIDEAKYLTGVPPNAYGDYVWQGLYVFNITDNDITFRGGITHLDDDIDLLKSGYYFYSEHSVKRSLYIGDVLYTISDKRIKMNSLITLEEINELELQ